MTGAYRKKIIPLLAAASLAASACGCTNTADGNNSANTVSENNTAAENSSANVSETSVTEQTSTGIQPMDTSPITLSLLVSTDFGGDIIDEDTAAKIAEKTGVTLEITAADGDIDADYFADNSAALPDLVFAGEKADVLAENGVLVPLDGFVSVGFGDNFTALYGDNIDSLRHSDGKLYTVGSGGSSSAQLTAEGTFQIRYEVLEELGYPQITTLEQLADCLSQYMENHPNATGLLLCGSQQKQWEDTVSRRVNLVLGYPDDGEFLIDEEGGNAVYKWTSPETKEYFKQLNKMYNEGTLDDDSFSMRNSAYVDRISGGNVLAVGDDPENYPSEYYCPLPVALDSEKNVMFLADRGFNVSAGIGITSGCEETERAFRFLDWLCSDEAQEIVGDIYSGDYGKVFPVHGFTEKNSDGEFYYQTAVEEIVSEYSDAQKAALEGYGITIFSELFPQSSELPKIRRRLISEYEIPAMSEEGILLETLETYVKTEVPKAISASADDFEEKWQEISDWCKANGSELLEELISERLTE